MIRIVKSNKEKDSIRTYEKRYTPLSNCIDNTEALINIITGLVNEEVSNLFLGHLVLDKPYQSINIDEDVKKISTAVYNKIRKNIISTDETILTSTAIMEMITSKTLSTILAYNSKFSN